MSVGEYVAVFVSIILGIAFSDLALSAHRLLRARERIEWHWASPVLAVFMLLNVVAFWWATFDWYRNLDSFTVAAFLPDVALFVLVFLMAAAVLPDKIPEARFSLREFYFREARYFWSLCILFVILMIANVDPRHAPQANWQAMVYDESLNILTLGLMIPLVVTKRAWYHYLVIVIIGVLIGGSHLVATIRS